MISKVSTIFPSEFFGVDLAANSKAFNALRKSPCVAIAS